MVSNEYKVAYELLVSIVDQGLNFNVAVKNGLKNTDLDTNQKNDITSLVGCELRHHFIFREIVKRSFGELNIKSAGGLYLLLANTKFLKKFEEDKMITFAKEIMLNNGVSLEQNMFETFYQDFKNSSNIIPSDIETGSIEFLSLRYNVPTYLVKMWQRQFGNKLTYKILKSITTQPLKTFLVNTLKISREDFLSKNKDFSPAITNDMLIYNGKQNYKFLDSYKIGQFIPLSLAQKHFLDSLELDPFKKVLFVSNWSSNMFIDLGMKFNKTLNFDVITSSGKEYFNMSNAYKSAGLKNVHFYRSNISSLITCVSKPVDTLFLLPENSSFDLLRTTPDYSLHFKQSSFDELIKNQMMALEECDQFINVDGELIYALGTISFKETHGLISQFLSKHKNYRLIDERQFLPFDEFNSIFYYAILKKVGTSSND